MSSRPLIARLILWRGNTPAIATICIGFILARFAPGWPAWAIPLTGLVVGTLIAAWFLLDSRRTGKIEGLVAQLMRVNHRLNGEIQQRARVETELAAARDEALELSRLKSQFLATMSHEIRTPMNGIIGMTDLLLDTGLTAEQQDFAESVRCCSDTLMTIIDDILDFAKIDSCTLQLQGREFEPRGLLEGVLDLLSGRAEAKGLKLTRELASSLPDLLIGDPGRLRQMLVILIGNAIKFTERGEVFVSAKAVESTRTSVELQVSIHDTGIGMSIEEQDRLFEAFYQTDGSTTRRYGGAGLGLAICKQLAEMMDGDVQVDSQAGKGSTFRLTVRLEVPAVDHAQGLIGLNRWIGESITAQERVPVGS